jgi:hypothetical protein
MSIKQFVCLDVCFHFTRLTLVQPSNAPVSTILCFLHLNLPQIHIQQSSSQAASPLQSFTLLKSFAFNVSNQRSTSSANRSTPFKTIQSHQISIQKAFKPHQNFQFTTSPTIQIRIPSRRLRRRRKKIREISVFTFLRTSEKDGEKNKL